MPYFRMSSFNNSTDERYFHSLIEISSLEFHTEPSMPVSIFTEKDTKFGLFKVKPYRCDPSTTPIVVQCTIDISSSMEELAGSYQKIDFIKQTLEKLLPYLLENFNIEIWIQIGLFNTTYMTLIPMQQLKRENIDDLNEKIRLIRCSGCTNLENAFIESRKIMEQSIERRPEYKSLHIFLTDGNPTDGIHDSIVLSKLISAQYPTLFIGYGIDHNASLLKNCANHLSHSYQFVDNFELTGQVYAEMLYSLMYTVMENPVIEIESGCIYDSLNDQWTNRLEIPWWVAEKEYIYHISALNPEDVVVSVSKDSVILFNTHELPLLMNVEDGTLEVRNFDKYIFKQKTMDLLSLVLRIQTTTVEIDTTEQLTVAQKELADFFKILRTYMREKGLLEDAFLKILCEDLSISYQTIQTQINTQNYDTNYATMNILSRRNAQATQALYRSGSARQPVRARVTRQQPLSAGGGLQRTPTNAYYDEEFDAETQIDEWNETDREYIMVDVDADAIESYREVFVTQNIYSPTGMDTMARNISS